MRIEDLIEKLKTFQKKGVEEVYSEQNMDFYFYLLKDNSLILTTDVPIGLCNRTNSYVFKSKVKGYDGFCPLLDEDLYKFEFKII